MKGAKTNRLQLCGFSLLSQISVILIISARSVEIDLKHQCGDGRSHFSTDSRKKSMPGPFKIGLPIRIDGWLVLLPFILSPFTSAASF